MTRAQILQEIADIQRRVDAGKIPLGSATGRLAALRRRLAEAR